MDYSLKISEICEYYKLTLRAFSDKTSISSVHNYLGKDGQRKSTPSADVIANILRAFPDVNPDWLLLNEGAMIRSAQKEKPSETLPDTELPVKYLKAIEELSQCRKEFIECLKGHPEGLPPLRPVGAGLG